MFREDRDFAERIPTFTESITNRLTNVKD